MDRIRREFKANKKAHAKWRLTVLVAPLVAVAFAYWLWPADVAYTVPVFLRMSVAGLVLVIMFMLEYMLLTE